MPETVSFTARMQIVLKRDRESGLYHGHVAEYPGILTQGKTKSSVKSALASLMKDIVENDDLEAYR